MVDSIDEYLRQHQRRVGIINKTGAMVEFLTKYKATDQHIQQFIAKGANPTHALRALINRESLPLLTKYIKPLIKFGADINKRDNGKTASSNIVRAAISTNNTDFIKLLLDNGLILNEYDVGAALNPSISHGPFDEEGFPSYLGYPSLSIVKILVDNIDRSLLYDDFLEMAIENKTLDIVKFFLEKGLSIKEETLNKLRTTPEIMKFVKEYKYNEYKKTTPGLAQVSVGKNLPQNVTSNIASMLSPTGKPPKSFLPKPDIAAREAIQAEKEALAAMRTGGKTRKYRGKKSLKSKQKTSKK